MPNSTGPLPLPRLFLAFLGVLFLGVIGQFSPNSLYTVNCVLLYVFHSLSLTHNKPVFHVFDITVFSKPQRPETNMMTATRTQKQRHSLKLPGFRIGELRDDIDDCCAIFFYSPPYIKHVHGGFGWCLGASVFSLRFHTSVMTLENEDSAQTLQPRFSQLTTMLHYPSHIRKAPSEKLVWFPVSDKPMPSLVRPNAICSQSIASMLFLLAYLRAPFVKLQVAIIMPKA